MCKANLKGGAKRYNKERKQGSMQDLTILHNNKNYLSSTQYYDSGNLSSRQTIHQKFSTGQQSWHDFIFELAKVKPEMTVLALGCGNAAQWRDNQFRFPDNCHIVLSDFSHGMLRDAARGLSRDHRFLFLCMDSMEAAFPKFQFDLITANHMLYHVPSVPQVLENAVRLLKSGGRFMAATNGVEHMSDLDDLLARFSKRLDGKHGMSSAFNLLNGEAQLRKYFSKIELHLYPSDLWVTNAKLLTKYAYSTPIVKENLGSEGSEEMTAFFERRIEHYGGILIRKQTGVFLAENPL